MSTVTLDREERRHPRFRVEDHTKLRIVLENNESYNASSKNISETGLQLHIGGNHEISIGDKIQIDLYFFEKLILSIDLVVRHVNQELVGGQFDTRDQLSRSMLQHFVSCIKSAA